MAGLPSCRSIRIVGLFESSVYSKAYSGALCWLFQRNSLPKPPFILVKNNFLLFLMITSVFGFLIAFLSVDFSFAPVIFGGRPEKF